MSLISVLLLNYYAYLLALNIFSFLIFPLRRLYVFLYPILYIFLLVLLPLPPSLSVCLTVFAVPPNHFPSLQLEYYFHERILCSYRSRKSLTFPSRLSLTFTPPQPDPTYCYSHTLIFLLLHPHASYQLANFIIYFLFQFQNLRVTVSRFL